MGEERVSLRRANRVVEARGEIFAQRAFEGNFLAGAGQCDARLFASVRNLPGHRRSRQLQQVIDAGKPLFGIDQKADAGADPYIRGGRTRRRAADLATRLDAGFALLIVIFARIPAVLSAGAA